MILLRMRHLISNIIICFSFSTIAYFIKAIIRPSKKKQLDSVPARPLKKLPTLFYFYFLFLYIILYTTTNLVTSEFHSSKLPYKPLEMQDNFKTESSNKLQVNTSCVLGVPKVKSVVKLPNINLYLCYSYVQARPGATSLKWKVVSGYSVFHP